MRYYMSTQCLLVVSCFLLFLSLSSLSLSVTDEQTNPGEASRQRESRRYCMPYKHAACAYQPHYYLSHQMPCTSTQADSAAWPDPPLFRTHYVNSVPPGWRCPQLLSWSLIVCSDACTCTYIAHTQKHACHLMLEGKTGHLFLSNTFYNAVCNKVSPI